MSLEWIETEVERFIEPLAEAAESVHTRRVLLLALGIDVDEAKALSSASRSPSATAIRFRDCAAS